MESRRSLVEEVRSGSIDLPDVSTPSASNFWSPSSPRLKFYFNVAGSEHLQKRRRKSTASESSRIFKTETLIAELFDSTSRRGRRLPNFFLTIISIRKYQARSLPPPLHHPHLSHHPPWFPLRLEARLPEGGWKGKVPKRSPSILRRLLVS